MGTNGPTTTERTTYIAVDGIDESMLDDEEARHLTETIASFISQDTRAGRDSRISVGIVTDIEEEFDHD